MARDPVCAMMVNEATAAFQSQYKGMTYYFCKIQCMMKFDKYPERYLERAAVRQRVRSTGSDTRQMARS